MFLMYIVCPHCGSSAQPKLVFTDYDDELLLTIREYVCGCGCFFEVNIYEDEDSSDLR